MKNLVLTIALLLLNSLLFGQTFQSNYSFVKKIKLFGAGSSEPMDEERSLLDLSQIDTVDVKNNVEPVIMGSITALSNDTVCILDLVIEKSSHPDFLPVGKSISCVIDYRNKLIYDQSVQSILPYSLASIDSVIKNDDVVKIMASDSMSVLTFFWNDELVEIKTQKDVPPSVRFSILDTSSTRGFSSLHTEYQFVTLDNYEEYSGSLTERINEIMQECEKREPIKTMVFL